MLTIIGDGEHAKVVRSALTQDQYLYDDGFHVAFVGKPGSTARRDAIKEMGDVRFYTITQNPHTRYTAFNNIGDGTFIGTGAIIQVGAKLGKHCVINTGAIVEHDCILGEGVHMAPRSVLGGGVKVGDWTTIGLGACVRDHVTIGSNCIIGMGAVVVKDVPDNTTVMGCPAK